MATYQENIMHKSSFLKNVCSKERLDALVENSEDEPQNSHHLFIPSAGMFEMAKQFDIVTGSLADGFFNSIGPKDGHRFTAFKNKMRLLHDRNAFEIEPPSQNQ